MTVIVKPRSDEPAAESHCRAVEIEEAARKLSADIFSELQRLKDSPGQSHRFDQLLAVALLARVTQMAVTEDHNALIVAALRDRVERLEAAQTKSLADAYRGAWLPGRYTRGSIVTLSGALWLCVEDSDGRPGQSATWRLVVKAPKAA